MDGRTSHPLPAAPALRHHQAVTDAEARGEGLLLEVHRRYGGWIQAYVRRLFAKDWEDVVQDVTLKLGCALRTLELTHDEAVRALVSKTLRSVCIDEVRRRARRPCPVDPETEPADPDTTTASTRAALDEDQARLRALWSATLTERDRQILTLRFRDGLSFRGIAEILGVPQGSVAGWYSRAMAALKEVLT